MSLTKTWYTLAEAAAKYGVGETQILRWVEEGVVRAEEEGNKVVRVDVDDLELKLRELTGR